MTLNPLSVNNTRVKTLEQAIDQIVALELAAHKPDPAKTLARQKAADFARELARLSGEVEQARVRMAAAAPPQASQVRRDYAYWKSQLENLESQKVPPPSDALTDVPSLDV